MRVVCCNAAMSRLGQKRPNMNRSLGSRRSAEMNGREVPGTEIGAASGRRTQASVSVQSAPCQVMGTFVSCCVMRFTDIGSAPRSLLDVFERFDHPSRARFELDGPGHRNLRSDVNFTVVTGWAVHQRSVKLSSQDLTGAK